MVLSNHCCTLQVHPRAVNAAIAAALPIMLATRALPEAEAEQAALLARHRAAAGALPLGAQYEAIGVSLVYASLRWSKSLAASCLPASSQAENAFTNSSSCADTEYAEH